MNNHGSISIVLIIIVSTLIAAFILFTTLLSRQSFNNNGHRSAIITSQNILAQYDRNLYNYYGILAYTPKQRSTIQQQFIQTLDVFIEDSNSYRLTDLDTTYEETSAQHIVTVENQLLKISRMYVTKSIIKEILKQSDRLEEIKEIKKEILDTRQLEELMMDFNEINHKIKIHQSRGTIRQFKNDLVQLKNLVKKIDHAIDKKIHQLDSGDHSIVKGYIKNLLEEKNAFASIHNHLEEIINLLEQDKNKKAYESLQAYLHRVKDQRINKTFFNQEISKIKDLFDFTNDTINPTAITFKETLDRQLNKNILLNEYLLGVLKASVHSDQRDYDFMNSKDERPAVFDSEIEYIINGHHLSKINELNILGKIFTIREISNLIHIYSSQEKMNYLNSLNLLGPGSTIFKHGLVVLWSAAESICDMKRIIDGKGTPLIKVDDGYWNLSIKHLESNNFDLTDQEDNAEHLFFYHDYLRLFLLSRSNELKIKRLFHLINATRQGNIRVEHMILKHHLLYHLKLENKMIQQPKVITIDYSGGYVDE